jgi:putative transposase
MVDHEAPVSIRRQCELLRVGRSGLYYEPVRDSAEDLALMRRLDELHMKWPFYGSRKLTLELRAEGHEINRIIHRHPRAGHNLSVSPWNPLVAYLQRNLIH